MSGAMTVQILLATCNGGRYLAAQLDSIFAQTWNDWQLLVRDDGSVDNTPDILADYRQRYPDKMVMLAADGIRLGACANFARLMAAADADYLLFCDQDDVWLPGKIARTMETMRALERESGAAKPLLVHTDLAVTDASLTVVRPSLWRYQHTRPEYGSCLNRLVVQNYATGCTLMFNRAARDVALPLPLEAQMHDWWLALVAAAFGRVGYLAEPLVLYRQHGLNDVGAQGFTPGNLLKRCRQWGETRAMLCRIQRQAGAFLERYHGRLTPAQREMLGTYSRLDSYNGLRRRWYLLKYRFFYSGLLRNLGRLIIG